MTEAGKIAVVAVGGNALILSEDKASIPDQARAAEMTVHHIVNMIENGWNVVLNLIAMTRLLSNRGDGLLEERCELGKEKMTVNFKNGLAIMAAHLEELVLTRAAALAATVTWMSERILAVRSRLRPGRSYPRQSRKPRTKWARGVCTTT